MSSWRPSTTSRARTNETFKLVLESDKAGAPLGSTAEAVGTIIDDEARVSVAAVSAPEGAASTPGTLQFQVVLDRALNADLSLQYELLDPDLNLPLDTAQRGTPPLCAAAADYLDLATTPGTPGTLTITWPHNPLQAVDLPAVTICGDSVVEPNESLFLRVWVPTGGEAVMEDDGGAFGTILNDDTPTITVADVSAIEGEMLEFKVSLTLEGSLATLATPVTLNYTIEQATPVSAERGVDYAAAVGFSLGGMLNFPTGLTTELTLPVDLLADYELEGDETFALRLSDADTSDDLQLAEVVATGTITDDPPPVLSVDDFTGPEGTTQFFTVTLANPRSGEIVTVDYVISGDEVAANADTATAPGHATKPADFEPDTGDLTGTVTFDPATACQTSCTVGVRLRADYEPEPDETLRLTLTNPSGAVLSGSGPGNSLSQIHGVGTITDVLPPTLSVDYFSGLEGTTQFFTVTLANPRSGEIVTVDYVISGDEVAANADTATAPGHATKPADFEPDTGGLTGTVTFDPATACQTSCTVGVRLRADYEPEPDETLRLTLTNPSGAVLSGSDPGNSQPDPRGRHHHRRPAAHCPWTTSAGLRGPPSPSRSRWPTPARGRS